LERQLGLTEHTIIPTDHEFFWILETDRRVLESGFLCSLYTIYWRAGHYVTKQFKTVESLLTSDFMKTFDYGRYIMATIGCDDRVAKKGDAAGKLELLRESLYTMTALWIAGAMRCVNDKGGGSVHELGHLGFLGGRCKHYEFNKPQHSCVSSLVVGIEGRDKKFIAAFMDCVTVEGLVDKSKTDTVEVTVGPLYVPKRIRANPLEQVVYSARHKFVGKP